MFKRRKGQGTREIWVRHTQGLERGERNISHVREKREDGGNGQESGGEWKRGEIMRDSKGGQGQTEDRGKKSWG